MHTKLLFVAMAAAILSGCGTLGATGDGGPDATASYVGSAAGKVVKNGSGGCLHSAGFSDESAIASCEGEKPAEKVAAAPPPPPPAEIEKVVLSGRALFPYDSSQLTGQGNSEMNTLIEKLRTYSDIELIDVVGHADSRGAAEYNQGLSERRAETVKSTLQEALPNVPVTASGLGETAPVASNDTAEGRRLNRRVEIRVEAVN